MAQPIRKSITALVLFLASAAAVAQAPKAPLSLRADAPDRYIVVPGDTLWGISERYTDSPWRWPELWNLNKEQIRNPHRIYPGDVILLDRMRAQLSIGGSTRMETVKLSPRVRSEALPKQEIPSIPAALIEPFIGRPLVVEPDGLEKAPTIVATQADRVMVSTGNKAYVRGLANSSGDAWHVYRKGNALVDPDTNQTLGYEAIYLGNARLTRAGEPATVELTRVVQEVGTGDKLIAAASSGAISYAPHAPTTQIRGRVMSIVGGLGKVGEAGPQAVITINRGKADGVEAGHVLALYSKGGAVRDVTKPAGSEEAMIALPDERSGLAFVFRVFDRVSYALVMHVTRPVNPLDVVQTP